VDVERGVCIVAVVGDGMTGEPGVAARFFSTLGSAGINVRAIAQGSSERNISAVISNEDSTRALRAIHSGFYLSSRTVALGLIGPGNVGGTLLDQLGSQAAQLKSEFGLEFRVRGIMGSTQMYLADHAVDLACWRDLYKKHAEAADWSRFEAHVNPEHLPHSAMVDCTAASEIAERYCDWFGAGMHVVTPNKKANTGSYEQYKLLHSTCRRHNTHFLYETTVGAGLPVIHTLKDLRATGDQVTTVEGVLSGTLAYLFNRYDGSGPFSEIVKEAHANGYTEPDPRDDLSGMDVARKLVIVARELGHRLELDEIPVESLVPADLAGGDAEDFLSGISRYDDAMQARWEEASNAGKVLRYVASLGADGNASVTLAALDRDHAFAHMNLTDNILRIASGRYSDNPLIVQGPGAGPDVTAAGIFADLLRLAAFLGAR
jgi:aspartokinase/homoserine dehydrogenase 1